MRQKRIERWTVIPCAALVVIFGVGVVLRPHVDFSEEENRALADRIAVEDVDEIDAELSAFYTDQFPWRLRFTAVKARAERLLGKQENNGVLFGAEGALFPRTELRNETILRQNLDAFGAFREQMAGRGIPVSLLAVPRSADVMTERLPLLYRRAYDPSLPERIADAGEGVILPTEILRMAVEPYYKTDHHWTTEGAYLAYTALMAEWGMVAYPSEFFQKEVVSRRFRGTAYSSAGGSTASADTVVLYRYDGDGDLLVTNSATGEVRRGFYDREAVGRKDVYEVFMGGNFGRLTVVAESGEKPRLLLVKDSFANAMIPFLALHFDLTVVDLRYDRAPLSKLLESGEFSRILVLWGADTLATDGSLGRLCGGVNSI